MYSLEHAREIWAKVPVDDVGYVSSAELFAKPADELRQIIRDFEKVRYDVNGWRNWGNKWRDCFGLDVPAGHDVWILDYGCGFGIEALQFARMGYRIMLFDILDMNVRLAERVLRLEGYPVGDVAGGDGWESIHSAGDIFYSNGVLHHTPDLRQILKATRVRTGGEFRLMLYTDRAWKDINGHEPIMGKETDDEKALFSDQMDGVGSYSDWYSKEKLEAVVGDFLDIVRFDYITSKDWYCAVTLKPKGASCDSL